MNCTFLKRRSKNYKYYLYCNKLKKEITFDNCKGCEYKEYKERKPIKSYKPIKKVSNKRVTVTKQTYEYVHTRDGGKCVLCHSKQMLQLHHILYRSERKDLINEPSNCVLLCFKCHQLVHSNKKKYQPMLLQLIKDKKKQ